MSVQRPSRWSIAIAVAAVVVLGAGAGCSKDRADDAAPPAPTVPSSTGDACTDPPGDLSATSGPGTGTEPAGVDLTAASARLEGDALQVSFTTAGPINLAPAPTFVVAQGNPYQPLSFEVRAIRDDTTGGWGLTLITWSQGEQRTSIVGQPAVQGNTITFSVPRSSLPQLANYLSFGSSSDVPGQGLVIDDCSSLATAPTIGGG